MAENYPRDRFDEIPDDLARVGVHRAPRRGGRGWLWVAWSALAAAVLIGVGVVGLFILNGTIDFKGAVPGGTQTPTVTASPTPTPTPIATVNPALNVTVLNGTTREGLATSVASVLEKAGWQHVSTANASASNLKTTTVYYSNPANEGAATAMAKSLPGAIIAQTQDYVETGADLTVVLGENYAG